MGRDIDKAKTREAQNCRIYEKFAEYMKSLQNMARKCQFIAKNRLKRAKNRLFWAKNG